MEEARQNLREAIRKIVELKEKGDDLANDAIKLLADLAALENMEQGT
jgi:predicted RNase H-like HicB family nuclease